jgi:hypothetical protein
MNTKLDFNTLSHWYDGRKFKTFHDRHRLMVLWEGGKPERTSNEKIREYLNLHKVKSYDGLAGRLHYYINKRAEMKRNGEDVRIDVFSISSTILFQRKKGEKEWHVKPNPYFLRH